MTLAAPALITVSFLPCNGTAPAMFCRFHSAWAMPAPCCHACHTNLPCTLLVDASDSQKQAPPLYLSVDRARCSAGQDTIVYCLFRTCPGHSSHPGSLAIWCLHRCSRQSGRLCQFDNVTWLHHFRDPVANVVSNFTQLPQVCLPLRANSPAWPGLACCEVATSHNAYPYIFSLQTSVFRPSTTLPSITDHLTCFHVLSQYPKRHHAMF